MCFQLARLCTTERERSWQCQQKTWIAALTLALYAWLRPIYIFCFVNILIHSNSRELWAFSISRPPQFLASNSILLLFSQSTAPTYVMFFSSLSAPCVVPTIKNIYTDIPHSPSTLCSKFLRMCEPLSTAWARTQRERGKKNNMGI